MGGRQVSWSGAFADGSWEGEASGSDGDDESGGKPPRRPLSAQLMMKVANSAPPELAIVRVYAIIETAGTTTIR